MIKKVQEQIERLNLRRLGATCTQLAAYKYWYLWTRYLEYSQESIRVTSIGGNSYGIKRADRIHKDTR